MAFISRIGTVRQSGGIESKTASLQSLCHGTMMGQVIAWSGALKTLQRSDTRIVKSQS
jgi:hypothetical protein